jgi:hypothetical protein
MIFRSRKSSNASKARGARQETPYDRRLREIEEKRSKLLEEAERAKRFIEEAPKIAAARQREQRDAYINNAISPGAGGGFSLPDDRYLSAEMGRAPRVRRRERREGKWVFFLLVLGLLAAAWWAWHTLFQAAF